MRRQKLNSEKIWQVGNDRFNNLTGYSFPHLCYELRNMNRLAMSEVKVSKIMTKHLIIASLHDTVEEAVKKMVNNDVECLPVISSEGILHGLVTFRDIVTKVVYPSAFERELKIEDIMAKNIITCSPDSTVLDVVKTMKNRHLRRLPVVNAENVLVGLVTDFDLALFGWELE